MSKGIALGALFVIVLTIVIVGFMIFIIIAPQAAFIRDAASKISYYLTISLP